MEYFFEITFSSAKKSGLSTLPTITKAQFLCSFKTFAASNKTRCPFALRTLPAHTIMCS